MENTGLVGLSRQIALRRELDVVANNVANMNTTGFKGERVMFEEFLMPVARDEGFRGTDRRISFTQDRAVWTDFAAGPTEQTGNPLDVALDGEGFLVVEGQNGERFTRNGSLQINAAGELVTNEGRRVLGQGGPIIFQPGDRDVSIGRDGLITVADGQRGRLRIVGFDQPQRLIKDGGSAFRAPEGVTPVEAPTTRVVQGHIEKSNVRSVTEISRMIELSRAYQSVSSMLERLGDLRRTAVERLGEVQ
jgi:flagellar basal-body rod protein FlgF/flagellar basal-body rod protein FlgG